jgi:hypothetical protein
VCRSVLSLLELQESSVREGEGFAAPGAGLVMLAANVTRTPDVPLPPIPELATEADIRSASLVGHRLLDASEVSPRAAEIRRLSTLFPTVSVDHVMVDQVGPPAQAVEAEERRD